jgi:Fur family peroxide stress response transcriptional regulator
MREDYELETSIIRAFRGKGYRATPQRIAIGRFILQSQNHPTTQMIYSEVKKNHPTVSLSTVYKTIKILKEVGLVKELSFSRDQARFDSSIEPHVNLVCLSCGKIRDAKSSLVRDIVIQVSAEENFDAEGQRFDIYGICQSCKRGSSGN